MDVLGTTIQVVFQYSDLMNILLVSHLPRNKNSGISVFDDSSKINGIRNKKVAQE